VIAEVSSDGEYLSRSTDHLANMASQLADLIGYPVLAYELIQNADDGGAELLSFRVLDDRLGIWNDRPFKDCGSRVDQQAWFVRQFGADVNLGNVAPASVLSLETLHLGLRADTVLAGALT
jgi:(2R)-phospho-3-sulfolactate synthase (ComA)